MPPSNHPAAALDRTEGLSLTTPSLPWAGLESGRLGRGRTVLA